VVALRPVVFGAIGIALVAAAAVTNRPDLMSNL
jgi:hypothetical protein